eukprot:3553099-Prymnesium_polylepis.1
MTSVLTLSSVIGHRALTTLRGHPLLGPTAPRTLGCGLQEPLGNTRVLWTDGSERLVHAVAPPFKYLERANTPARNS